MFQNRFKMSVLTRFVRVKDKDVTPAMTDAFDLMHNELEMHSPEWIDEHQCLEIQIEKDEKIYICDPFEGRAFDHLKMLGCRILGPQCVLACLNFKLEVPSGGPFYNLSFKGVVISCTSMKKTTREQMHGLVRQMAGKARYLIF